MLTVLRFFGFLPRFFQRSKRAGLGIQSDGVGAAPRRRKAIADKIEFRYSIFDIRFTDQCIDNIIDQFGIDHGTISCDANNNIRFGPFGGLIITIQDIIQAAARKGDAAKGAVFRHRVIGGVRCRGKDGFGNGSRPRSADKDALQHRLSGKIGKNLSGQTRRTHPPLNDGNDARFHCWGAGGSAGGATGLGFCNSATLALCSSNSFSNALIRLRCPETWKVFFYR